MNGDNILIGNMMGLDADRRRADIKARKEEIRKLVDEPGADLDALGAELDGLEAEEHRMRGAEAVANGEGTLIARYGDGAAAPRSGAELRAFGLGDDIRSIATSDGGPNLAAVVRGMATGDWSHVTREQRALISSGAAAAIPGASVLAIQEKAMQQSVVFKAGAKNVNVDRPSEKVARVVSTGAPEWLPDTADRELDDQAIVITPEDLTAFSAWLFTECSIETLEDAHGLEDAITSAFAQQLALLYDQAALAGTGSDMPKGVCAMTTATDGIIELASVGDLVDHKPFVRGAGAVLGMNHTPSSVMIDVDDWTELAMLADSTGQPIQPPKAYQDLKELVTNYLPAGNAVVADWSKWLFGTRTGIQLEVSRLGDGFKRGFVQIRAYVRFGGIPVDPSAFCRLSGITLPEESPE